MAKPASTALDNAQKSASKDDAQALYCLGQAYRMGRGVEADANLALKHYREAAELGHLKSADNHALLLFQRGDRKAAMPMIESASRRGDPRAQYLLALAHFNADHASKDWPRAYALMTLAERAGLPQARNALKQLDRFVSKPQRKEAREIAARMDAEQANAPQTDNAARSLCQPVAPLVDRKPTPAPPIRSSGALVFPTDQPPATQTAARSSPAKHSPAKHRKLRKMASEWRVQLGAFGVAGNAERLWSDLARDPALSGQSKATVHTGRVTILYAVGFADRSAATHACAALKSRGRDCLVTRL